MKLLLLLLSRFSRVRLCANPEMAAHQAPPSLGFSRQEHWSGLPFPSPMHESEKWKGSRSVVSDSQQPHGLQPTRLLRPWDFPGKSAGVGCHCLLHLIPRRPLLIFFLCSSWQIYPHCWEFSLEFPLPSSNLWNPKDYYCSLVSLKLCANCLSTYNFYHTVLLTWISSPEDCK